MGVKGVGEAGTIAAAPAVINAVLDALAPLGVHRDRDARVAPAGLGRDPYRPRRTPDDPRRVRLRPGGLGRRGDRRARRARRRREDARGRDVAHPAHEAAARDARRCSSTSAGSATSRTSATTGDHVAIGALTRHRDLETSDLLAQRVRRCSAASRPRSATTRSATAAPSAARSSHGDPASDLPAVLLALDATFVARGPSGERTIAAGDFFEGFLETALAPDELLTEIRVPKAGAGGWAYQKFNRRAQDWAIVGALAVGDNGSTRVVAREHGQHAAARLGRRAGARGRRVRAPTPRSTPPTAPSPRATSTPRRSSASTSPACWCGARWRRHRVEPGPTRRPVSEPGVAVAVLAGGRGSRVASDVPKPLLELDGRPLVAWALDAAMASGLRPVFLVTGYRSGAVAAAAPPGVVVARADALDARDRAQPPGRARSGSRAGSRSPRSASASPTSPGSAPRRTGGWRRPTPGARELAVATYDGQRANPVLLGRTLWPEALRLTGDVGARSLMGTHRWWRSTARVRVIPQMSIRSKTCRRWRGPCAGTPAIQERDARMDEMDETDRGRDGR